MGSGDYEAIGYPAIPRAPRAPQFAPQHPQYHPQMVTNRGGNYNQTGPFPSQQGPASNRVPAPANSLSPVAMASARNAAATGGYAAQDTQEVKARPSAKAGFSILFAGAIIGGLIGAVMHARESAADAYLAASVQQVQQKDSANGDPPIGNIMVPALSPSAGVLPSLIPGALPADKPLDEKTAKKTKGGGKTKIANSGGAVDTRAEKAIEDKPEKAEKPVKGKKGPKGDDDGYTVASSGDKEEKAEKAEKTEKSSGKKTDKGEKSEKGDKNGDSDTAPKKATKKGDADAVLRAAMGATENTL